MKKHFLSVTEYAKRKKVSRQAILKRIKRGTLEVPVRRVGRSWIIQLDK